MAEKKINLQEILLALDTNDKGFYSRLDDEQKKEFSPWLMMRYASSVTGENFEYYLTMVNEIVNVNFSILSKHPELLWMLLSICGSGRKEFHPFIQQPKKKGQLSGKRLNFIKSLYPMNNDDELRIISKTIDNNVLIDAATAMGMSKTEIEEIVNG